MGGSMVCAVYRSLVPKSVSYLSVRARQMLEIDTLPCADAILIRDPSQWYEYASLFQLFRGFEEIQ